jgi:hypothetical protein
MPYVHNLPLIVLSIFYRRIEPEWPRVFSSICVFSPHAWPARLLHGFFLPPSNPLLRRAEGRRSLHARPARLLHGAHLTCLFIFFQPPNHLPHRGPPQPPPLHILPRHPSHSCRASLPRASSVPFPACLPTARAVRPFSGAPPPRPSDVE